MIPESVWQVIQEGDFLPAWLSDASPIWTRQLKAASSGPILRLVLDCLGCGGSDAIESHCPNSFLTIVAEFIALLKKQHLNSSRKCRLALVGHDWGTAFAHRLAAET